jgi:hypothetical protein
VSDINTFDELRAAYRDMWSPPDVRSGSRGPPPGWLPLIVEMCEALSCAATHRSTRYASLVFPKYSVGCRVSWMARGRGAASANTSEVCGEPGQLCRGAPVLTLCELHADQRLRGDSSLVG